jgi:hypothetical protein
MRRRTVSDIREKSGRCRGVAHRHEVDHLISLELGGSNAIRNLWPEPYAGKWGARTKDVLENRLHELVCDRRLTLRSAQRQEARDWVAAYRKYVGPPMTASGGSVTLSGGFYASSYPTAHDLLRRRSGVARTVHDVPCPLRDVRPSEGPVPELPPPPAVLI